MDFQDIALCKADQVYRDTQLTLPADVPLNPSRAGGPQKDYQSCSEKRIPPWQHAARGDRTVGQPQSLFSGSCLPLRAVRDG